MTAIDILRERAAQMERTITMLRENIAVQEEEIVRTTMRLREAQELRRDLVETINKLTAG